MHVYENSEIRIECELEMQVLEHFYMEEQFNEHMSFMLTGIISGQTVGEYERKNLLNQKLAVYDCSNDQESLLCRGVVTELEISVVGSVYRIMLKGASVSIILDRKKKCRSFQDTSKTYKEILREIQDNEATIFYKCLEEKRPDAPIIQYQETDWELIRRLASHLHTVVTADTIFENCIVIMGSRKADVYKIAPSQHHRFCAQKNRGNHGRLSCCLRHPFNMRLGDEILLEDRRWLIGEKRVWFENGRLEKEYTLGRIRDWILSDLYNDRLNGTVIFATVLKRQKEFVKLWLEIDHEKNEQKAFWYPYLPETGNLMYAIPEEGTKVTLNFPDNDERHAFVGYCFHSERNSENLDHRIKKMQIPGDKKFSLAPDTILFSGKKHGERNSFILERGLGMIFSGSQPVRILAKGSIYIQSGLSCSAIADNQITVKQTGEKNSIEMGGNQIRFQYLP